MRDSKKHDIIFDTYIERETGYGIGLSAFFKDDCASGCGRKMGKFVREVNGSVTVGGSQVSEYESTWFLCVKCLISTGILEAWERLRDANV
jgi:hypothetical protein